MNTARRPFVALCLAFASLGPAACGGPDANELIDQTFSGSKEVKSGKVTLGLDIRAQGSPQLSQPITLKLSGPFQTQGKGQLPKFDFTLAVNAAGQAISAGATSTGQAGFLEVQGTPYQLSDQIFAAFRQGYQQAQSRAQAEKGKQDANALGVDPRQWLTKPEKVGDEDVAGTETVHVSSQLDVPRLLADVNKAVERARSQGLPQAGQLPGSITPQQQKQVADAVKSASFDFWTGKDDKVLRRLVIKVAFQVPEAERTATQGVTGGTVGFNLEMADLNETQTISAPANPRPFDELAGRSGGLGGLLGGAPAGATP